MGNFEVSEKWQRYAKLGDRINTGITLLEFLFLIQPKVQIRRKIDQKINTLQDVSKEIERGWNYGFNTSVQAL